MLAYYDQTVGWIRMKLGTEVSLGHIALDGDLAPPQKIKGHTVRPPIFGPCLVVKRLDG